MDSSLLDVKWFWHPEWSEVPRGSAGTFVHFRKQIILDSLPTTPLKLQISADTKYKLYINSKLVCMGPVKGDEHLWFYDQVDVQPYLTLGVNNIAVRVLRVFHATNYATSFPRLSVPGLFVRCLGPNDLLAADGEDTPSWEAALDSTTELPTDLAEDDFLHIYERVNNSQHTELNWMPVKELVFPNSHGLMPPWKLSPRLIPRPRLGPVHFKAIHNIQSIVPIDQWQRILVHPGSATNPPPLHLPAGTSHYFELEADHHLTAYLNFRFQRPGVSASTIKITYSECYENEPTQVPYLRRKGDRCDNTKLLLGPGDSFIFGGQKSQNTAADLMYHADMEQDEIFSPFHFRTFRFMKIDIHVVQDSELVLKGIELTSTNYPLNILAGVNVGKTDSSYRGIWDTGVRTLINCMHDCYEDCPFYEQLQYAMDARSSILFTYAVSGDDRPARQAIMQLHNSYQPDIGLTASRAPAHQLQVIPHFSLFWICTVTDHFEYYNDANFIRHFTAVCDGVLEHFARRLDPATGLVLALKSSPHWDFVDWTDAWRPMGIPPAATRTGFCTYTSMLYAYTLQRMAMVLAGIQRAALAAEYKARADSLVQAIQKQCFDGHFFTDGLAAAAILSKDYSEHSQIWAVLCGAASGERASRILAESLSVPSNNANAYHGEPRSLIFTAVSTAMSFYTLRALSIVGGSLYNDHFHSFWEPWRAQLALNLSTWEEDSVSQRSDCHAWGCAALYEFTREVAGITPAKPGWAAIRFKPRVSLFREVDIKEPFGRSAKCKSGVRPGVARVRWRTEENGDVRLSLALEMDRDQREGELKMSKVLFVLPSGVVEEVEDPSKELVRWIKAEDVS